MSELRIKTPCGFEARVNEDALKDLEIYEAIRAFIAAVEAGTPPDIRGACAALLGEKGFKAFVEYEKKHEGYVRVDHAAELIQAVTEGLKDKKK